MSSKKIQVISRLGQKRFLGHGSIWAIAGQMYEVRRIPLFMGGGETGEHKVGSTTRIG